MSEVNSVNSCRSPRWFVLLWRISKMPCKVVAAPHVVGRSSFVHVWWHLGWAPGAVFRFFFDPETSKEQLDVATSFVVVSCKLGVSKNSGTPKSSILIGFSIYKPSILGYPYFWKHPFLSLLFWWRISLWKTQIHSVSIRFVRGSGQMCRSWGRWYCDVHPDVPKTANSGKKHTYTDRWSKIHLGTRSAYMQL